MKNSQHNTPEQTDHATPEQSRPTQQVRAIDNTTQLREQTRHDWHHTGASKYKTIHASKQTTHPSKQKTKTKQSEQERHNRLDVSAIQQRKQTPWCSVVI